MSPQNRIYVTLSPRMRKALELCAALDGSAPTSYAAQLLFTALHEEIERHPALQERWVELEREALQRGSWEELSVPHVSGGEEESTSARKQPIKGWRLAGSHPRDYEYGIDDEELYQGKASAYLRSKTDEADGFGTLMQTFKAEKYQNGRLRLAAKLKAQDVIGWAGLWLRVDGAKREVLSFDNMQDRAIKGSVDWQTYEVVVDVPETGSDVAFGILLNGTGQVWINNVQCSRVGNDVPTTSVKKPDEPSNLDFVE